MSTISIAEKIETQHKTAKPLLYAGIVSICMVFGGLTSAYVVRSNDPGWLHFGIPFLFYVSAGIIFMSSVTLFLATRAAKKDNYRLVQAGLLATLLLGIAFMLCQYMAWQSLVEQGIFLTGKSSNPAGSFIYLISGAHIVHTLAGLIVLAYTYYQSNQKKYHSKNLLGLQLCSIYWHFLDLLWIYLLIFLILYH